MKTKIEITEAMSRFNLYVQIHDDATARDRATIEEIARWYQNFGYLDTVEIILEMGAARKQTK